MAASGIFTGASQWNQGFTPPFTGARDFGARSAISELRQYNV